jgi:hypothetical protein
VDIGGELDIATTTTWLRPGSWLHSTWTGPGGAPDGHPRSPDLDEAHM